MIDFTMVKRRRKRIKTTIWTCMYPNISLFSFKVTYFKPKARWDAITWNNSWYKFYNFSDVRNEHYYVNESTLSMDPEDQKWDHFREDTLFHGFHVLLHQLHDARKPKEGNQEKPPRLDELFWYAHQQLIRRWDIIYYYY